MKNCENDFFFPLKYVKEIRNRPHCYLYVLFVRVSRNRSQTLFEIIDIKSDWMHDNFILCCETIRE